MIIMASRLAIIVVFVSGVVAKKKSHRVFCARTRLILTPIPVPQTRTPNDFTPSFDSLSSHVLCIIDRFAWKLLQLHQS